MIPTIVLVVELVVLFVGVSFAVEVLQRRLGSERLKAWMGGRPVTAALKGIAVGFVTPFCTYSAVPLLVGMRRAGVPPAGYIGFVSAAPVLDPILFGALWLIVGPTVAVLYLVVTFTAAMTLSLAADRLGVERHLKPLTMRAPVPEPAMIGTAPAPGTVDPAAVAESDPWQGWARESRRALRASWSLLRSFGPLLAAGLAIGVAIEAVVSPDAAARLTTGSAGIAVPVASAMGTPLYFSTELFVPIANSLRNAGVGVGAIVALTISGAGANLPEFVVLSKMATTRVIGIFVGYVFAVAMLGGFLAHLIAG